KPSRNDVEEIVSQYVPDFGTRQFLLKNLYWKEPGQLAFRRHPEPSLHTTIHLNENYARDFLNLKYEPEILLRRIVRQAFSSCQ
ncbi:hypothetical protein AB9T88_19265, partial [Flavobacterium sp. LBUM151]